jgi:aflatoxin B1 aldehyde reductase
MAWEVAQVCDIYDCNSWIKLSVYQGMYNTLYRFVEPEPFPCLQHDGMVFYSYNPLAGGYLTSRYHCANEAGEVEKGSRFDPNAWHGKGYRARYMNEDFFAALDILRPVAKKHGLTEVECALRWMTHHSMSKRGVWRCCDYWGVKHETSRRELG